MTFRLTTRPGHPTFTDLPWEQPLDVWESGRFVAPVRGISRHVVRFVAYGPEMYALKELPDPIAEREYRLLRELGSSPMPVVDAVGLATGRRDDAGDELQGVLITRHLPYSLPYRALFSRRSGSELREPLLDALAGLLVRLHVAGFYWGDCSLSNTLFRRDAGALAAYLVDAETGELHEQLSAGQRRHDVAIARENVAGELYDVIAAGDLAEDEIDPVEYADDLVDRYTNLWSELTTESLLPDADRHWVDHRVRRLNELGFDVREIELIETTEGWRLRFETEVVEPGHHRRRLLAVTGLDTEENQARRLLNDIELYRCDVEQRTGALLAPQVAAVRWLVEVFEPTLAKVPEELRRRLEPAEVYHQLLEHRWFLSEHEGHDVGLDGAVASYVADVLAHVPDERQVMEPVTGEVPIVAGDDDATPLAH